MILNLDIRRAVSIGILFAFLANTLEPLPAQAQPALQQAGHFHLPVPGVMVHLSPPLDPPMLKGMRVHSDNPFKFDFILDQGDGVIASGQATKGSHQEQIKQESIRLIKYFLASLTIPEKDLWVNLSPYEKDRIIPQSFGLTEMGRDLLAEDYMLKQITASLIYPEDEIGRKFWKRIYQEAEKKFGTTNIQVNTFNKVWIIPDKAVVYENVKAGTAYVVGAKLKVMLEQDYLSLALHEGLQSGQTQSKDTNQLGSQIVREIVIPELTKEVNEDKNFAHLRQVYNSLILATWYKKKIKDSILAQVYEGKRKVAGVGYGANDTEAIYQRYLRAYKKGVFNYIKEAQDPVTQVAVPRKYFSGGVELGFDQAMSTTNLKDGIFEVISGSGFTSEKLNNAMVIDVQFNQVEPKDKAMKAEGHEKPAIDRRKFLMISGAGAALAALGYVGWKFIPEHAVPIYAQLGLTQQDITTYWLSDSSHPIPVYGQINFSEQLFPSHLYEHLKAIYVLPESSFHRLIPNDGTIAIERFKGIEFKKNSNLNPAKKNGYWRKVSPGFVHLSPNIRHFTINEIAQEKFSKKDHDAMLNILEDVKNGKSGDYESSREILLRSGDTMNAFYFAHEIFHDFWAHNLNETTRQQLKDLYDNNRGEFYVVSEMTEYAYNSDAEEAFCEMAKLWVQNPRRVMYLYNNPILRPFIDKVIEGFSWNNNGPSKGVTVRFYPGGGDLLLNGNTIFIDEDFSGTLNQEAVIEKLRELEQRAAKSFHIKRFVYNSPDKVTVLPGFELWPSVYDIFLDYMVNNIAQLDKSKQYLSYDEYCKLIDLIDPNNTDIDLVDQPDVPPRTTIDLKGVKELIIELKDRAMTVPEALPQRGGIDLTSGNMNLQTKVGDSRLHGNDDNLENDAGIKLHLDPAMLVQLQNAPGFEPVIISVHPLKSLQEFLGLTNAS